MVKAKVFFLSNDDGMVVNIYNDDHDVDVLRSFATADEAGAFARQWCEDRGLTLNSEMNKHLLDRVQRNEGKGLILTATPR